MAVAQWGTCSIEKPSATTRPGAPLLHVAACGSPERSEPRGPPSPSASPPPSPTRVPTTRTAPPRLVTSPHRPIQRTSPARTGRTISARSAVRSPARRTWRRWPLPGPLERLLTTPTTNQARTTTWTRTRPSSTQHPPLRPGARDDRRWRCRDVVATTDHRTGREPHAHRVRSRAHDDRRRRVATSWPPPPASWPSGRPARPRPRAPPARRAAPPASTTPPRRAAPRAAALVTTGNGSSSQATSSGS